MKTLLLSTFVLGSIAALAQTPTLTTANILSSGESQTLYVVDSNASNLDAIAGSNVTWDYSALGGYGNTITESILTASSTDFPSSTLVDELQGNLSIYENVQGDTLFSQGYFFSEATLGDVTAQFTADEMKVMTYPFTYGDNFSDALDGTVLAPSLFPAAFPYTGFVTVTADGHGTLLLGSNTYTDVLRVKTVENSLAQTGLAGDIPIVRTQYYYYQPGSFDFPIFMHVNMTAAGNSISVVYSKDMLPILSVDDLSQTAEVSVYPNPVKDDMNVKISSTENFIGELTVRNILGQEVYQKTVSVNSGSNNIKMDASNLNAGVYLVNLSSGKSNITKKVIVK